MKEKITIYFNGKLVYETKGFFDYICMFKNRHNFDDKHTPITLVDDRILSKKEISSYGLDKHYEK